MTTDFNPGQLVRLTGVVKDSAGTATDPTAAALELLRPDGVFQTYLSSTGWSSQGTWTPVTNTPTLADGTGTAGHYYTVSAAGNVSLGTRDLSFEVGDRVFYDGDYWRRLTGIKTPTLTKPSTGTFYYDYPTPDISGDYRYSMISVGIVKAAATPVSFNVAGSALFS